MPNATIDSNSSFAKKKKKGDKRLGFSKTGGIFVSL